MRKRRRTRYTWLLNTGTVGPAADTAAATNGREFLISVPANGTTAVSIVDLLNDTPSEDTVIAATTLSMGASTQNEYFIKRIVGKFFAALDNNVSGRAGCYTGLGIFIARAGDPEDFAGAENLPIGSATAAVQRANYAPNALDNIREPWIWRRTWVLTQPGVAGGVADEHFPLSTAGYGSVADGPHIDAKTARRVRDGERLWAVVSACNWPINTTGANANQLRATLDYRILGASRKAHNRSAF